jgi:hypothetical protein
MRRTILAFTVVVLAPTAAMALPAVGALVGGAAGASVQERQIAPGTVSVSDQGSWSGNVILAKGDKSGTGPGAGGHKGQKKGGQHGKQHKDKKD